MPDLQVHYFREVLHALNLARKALRKLRERPADMGHRIVVHRQITNVRDLAMIHGFDGVERISTRLCNNLKEVMRRAETLQTPFIQKVDAAVVALQRVVILEGDSEARSSIQLINRDSQPREVSSGKTGDQLHQASRPGHQLALPLEASAAAAPVERAPIEPIQITDVGDFEEALVANQNLEVVQKISQYEIFSA